LAGVVGAGVEVTVDDVGGDVKKCSMSIVRDVPDVALVPKFALSKLSALKAM
jgi:uncharacterized protein YlxW (UPF0749 family)